MESIRHRYLKDKTLVVRYQDLNRFRNEETRFHCQRCGGGISINKDKRGNLLTFDRCVMCGQAYEYSNLKYVEE